MNLLLIEDEEVGYQVVKRITLRAMKDVKLTRVASMGKALKFIKNQNYDAIITDLRLPDSKYDIEVVEEIRKIDKRTPILIYTGNYLDKTLRQAIEAGANRFMVKGMIGVLKDLPETIKNMISENQAILKIQSLNNELRRRNSTTS